MKQILSLLVLVLISCNSNSGSSNEVKVQELDSLQNVIKSQQKLIDSLKLENMRYSFEKVNALLDEANNSLDELEYAKSDAIQAFREHLKFYYPNCVYKEFGAVRKPDGSYDIVFQHKKKNGNDIIYTNYYYCTYNVNLKTNKVRSVKGTLEGLCNY